MMISQKALLFPPSRQTAIFFPLAVLPFADSGFYTILSIAKSIALFNPQTG
jgi:hypothetical protein